MIIPKLSIISAISISTIFFFFKQKTAYEIRNVTGVQTCALPISGCGDLCERPAGLLLYPELIGKVEEVRRHDVEAGMGPRVGVASGSEFERARDKRRSKPCRSEERRVGKEGRSRWATCHEKEK